MHDLQPIQFERPSAERFRSIRYHIAKVVKGYPTADAIATADLETELWLADLDAAKAADLLQDTTDITQRRWFL